MNNESFSPKAGDRYIVETPFRTIVLTQWRAPLTGGSEAVLPAGLRFVVNFDPPAGATGVSAAAEPRELWEHVLVDTKDLKAEKYDGFSLSISFNSLDRFCRRL